MKIYKVVNWPRNFKRLKRGTGRRLDAGAYQVFMDSFDTYTCKILQSFTFNHTHEDLIHTLYFLHETGFIELIDDNNSGEPIESDWFEYEKSK